MTIRPRPTPPADSAASAFVPPDEDAPAHAIPPWAIDGSRPGGTTPLAPPLRLTIDLVLAARRWRAMLDDRLRPLGQSSARMEAMAVISRSPPQSAQIEIARRIGVEGATFTRMLDSLEADDLVERHPHPTDRRTKHIRLTATGQAALAELLGLAAELRTQLLDGIDPAEVDRGNMFLEMLLARMDDGLPRQDQSI